jgi:flavin reductase (DIM6/NTAB) family NADH-FMN oxidoreductase RutF
MKKSLGAKTLAYVTPVWVIGSYDKNDRANAMTASWAGICCSDPASVTVSIRKPRYSFQNIIDKQAFTVNIPTEDFVKEADYLGIVSGADEDKLAKAGLTTTRSDLIDAPIINEFPLSLECKLLHTHEVGAHTMFIGAILDVKADETVLDDKGNPDMTKLKPFSFAPGSMKYYKNGEFLADGFNCGLSLK